MSRRCQDGARSRLGRHERRHGRRVGARRHAAEHARIGHRAKARAGVGRGEKPPHLGAHPLGREPLDARREPRAGGEARRIRRPLAVPGVEAEEAQDAKVVLADAGLRIAHEAQPPREQVWQAPERVHEPPTGLGVERVHGEVAPPGVLGQVVREGHHGVAPVGLHVAAEGRDLVRHAVRDDRDGAVLDARGDRLEPRGLRQRRHALGDRVGRHVHVGHGTAQERVAHAAPHGKRPVPRPRERAEHGLGRGRLEPGAADPERPCAGRTGGGSRRPAFLRVAPARWAAPAHRGLSPPGPRAPARSARLRPRRSAAPRARRSSAAPHHAKGASAPRSSPGRRGGAGAP